MTTFDYPTTPLTGVDVTALAWLTGAWRGVRQENEAVDEYWSYPTSDSMVGVYRWRVDEHPFMYEMMLVEQDGDGVVARFKHIDPAFGKREDDDKHYGFDLVQLNGTDAIFFMRDYEPNVWLFYRRDGDTLTTYYQRDGVDPTAEADWWVYHLQK